MKKHLKRIATITIASALFAMPVMAELETEPQMPESMEELWQMYLDLMEDYKDLQAKYEELLLSIEDKTEAEMETEAEKPAVSEYKTGAYKVGSTIPAGEYIIYSLRSDSIYYSVTSDPNGNDIIYNEFRYGNGFATIYDGEYFTLQDAYAVPYTGNEPIENINNSFMAKVGDQLEAGEYLAKATDDYGYYAIYTDTRFQNIVSNDFFESTSYFHVEDGQYISIDGCELIKQ